MYFDSTDVATHLGESDIPEWCVVEALGTNITQVLCHVHVLHRGKQQKKKTIAHSFEGTDATDRLTRTG